MDNFFEWMRAVGIVYGYTVFLDRAKSGVTTDIWGPRNRASLNFYELTSMKKMRDPWSS